MIFSPHRRRPSPALPVPGKIRCKRPRAGHRPHRHRLRDHVIHLLYDAAAAGRVGGWDWHRGFASLLPGADENCFHFAFLFPAPFVLLHRLCLWQARSHHAATLLPSFSMSLLYPALLLLPLSLLHLLLLPTLNIFAIATPDSLATGRHFGEILRKDSVRIWWNF